MSASPNDDDPRPLVDVLASSRDEAAPAVNAVLDALESVGARGRPWIGAELRSRYHEDRDPSGHRPDGFVVVYDPDDRALNYALGSLRGMRRPVLLVVLKQDGSLLPFDLREFRFAIFDPTDPSGSVRQIHWAVRLLVERPAAA